MGMDMSAYSRDKGLSFEDADEYFLYQYATHMDLKVRTLLLSCMGLTTNGDY